MHFRILLFCFCLVTGSIFAINTDSLLNRLVNIKPPYLIINITSTECITCRAGSANILNKLADSIIKKKIIILSDDKNMSLYFQQNNLIYNGLKTIYNRELSNALALGPSATVCLFQNDKEHKYLLTKVNDDTIRYFKQILAGNHLEIASYKRFKIKDTIFNSAGNLFFGGGQAIIFNSQFQIGLQLDLAKKSKAYIQTEYSDSTIETLYRIISTRVQKLVDVKSAKDMLRGFGVDQITVHGVNLSNRSLIFKLYAISMDVTNNFNDTNIFAVPVIFIAQKNYSTNNFFDLNQSKTFFPLTPIYNQHDTLDPLFSYNYEIRDNNLFVPYWDIRHSKSNNIDGREIKQTTCMYIAAYKNYLKSTKQNPEIFKIYDTASGPGNFFLRIYNDEPVIISETNKTITFLGKGTKLNFSDFTLNDGEFVKKFFDVSFTSDTMWFAATTDKDNCVKGYRLLNAGRNEIEKLSTEILYESMRIDGGNLLACKKNEESNELILDLFSIR